MSVLKSLFSGRNVKRIIVVTFLAFSVVAVSAYMAYQYKAQQERIEQERIAEEKRLAEERELDSLREQHSIDGISGVLAEKYAAIITEDEKAFIADCENNMMQVHAVDDFDKHKGELDELVSQLDTRLSEWEAEQQRIAEEEARKAAEETKRREEAERQSAARQSSTGGGSGGNGGGLTASSGVNNFGGRRETYYSSRVAYHHRTNEWWVDGEGFYRTSDGYYVVAASDMAQGTVFQGSKGACKVLDSGCAAGVTDYYVNW